MKTFPHLVQKLFFSPLLVLPSTYATFESALLQRLGLPSAEVADPWAGRLYRDAGETTEATTPQAAETPAQRTQRRVNNVLKTYGDVAVISIDGVIDKRLSDYELDCYGGCDLSDIDAAISQVAADPRIERVVFDFNSPGGSAAGVPETAARMRQLSDYKKNGGAGKETHARIELLAASAAQWLAAQCDQVTACPSATVGSIGVYCAFLDQTGFLEKAGLKVQLIKAGKFKAMGASFKSLTDEETGMLQTNVDRLWSEFKSEITARRPNVSESTMQGQCFRADEGKKLGLVDALNPQSLDEFVASLLS